MIEQNQKSFSYFMDRTIHNMNFSKTKVRNNTIAFIKFATLNLKSNISLRNLLTVAVFPSKEHESKVPEPPFIHTAPPWLIDILSLIKIYEIDDA